MTISQLFIKSPVEDLIILCRPPISSTTSFLILSHPKQSGISSNKMTFVLLSRGNVLFSRKHTDWSVSNLPDAMKTGQWRIGKKILWSDETKISRIGSDERTYTWKKRGEPLSDITTTPTVKHGVGNNLIVWGGIGWNGVWVLTEVQEIMDIKQYCEILDWGVVESLKSRRCQRGREYFSRTMTPNTPPRRQPSGLKTTTLKS